MMYVEFQPPVSLTLKNVPEGRFLLGCSGGIDSVVLFDLLVVHDVDFEVAHVNYELRGRDSEGDEEFVRALCREYSIPCHVHRETPKHFPGNTQDNARRIRYAFFGRLLEERKLNWILTAHHGDDQVETILMNLARGSGLRGLAGIPVRRDVILRPLLPLSRRHILEYAEYHGLKWREDETNDRTYYKRNALRVDVVPNLRRIFPDYVRGVGTSVRIISNVLNAVDYVVKESGLMTEDPYGPRFPKKSWMEQDFGPFLLFHLLQPYGFSEAQCKSALVALREGRVGRFFSAPGGKLFVERGYLQLYVDLHKLVGLAPLRPEFPVKTIAGRVYVRNLDADFVLQRGDTLRDTATVALRPGEILHLRRWRAGDEVRTPDGIRRKVSDVLTNHKVPAGIKSEYPVVVDMNNNLVWLPGLNQPVFRNLDSEFPIRVEVGLGTYRASSPFWAG